MVAAFVTSVNDEGWVADAVDAPVASSTIIRAAMAQGDVDRLHAAEKVLTRRAAVNKPGIERQSTAF
jgi:hypothetical protein